MVAVVDDVAMIPGMHSSRDHDWESRNQNCCHYSSDCVSREANCEDAAEEEGEAVPEVDDSYIAWVWDVDEAMVKWYQVVPVVWIDSQD